MLNNLDNICNIFFPQRNTLVEEIHKGIVNLRRIVNTQKKSSAIVSKSDKSTFETKNKNILEFNRTNDKNNNWKVLGSQYNQFVFVSVSK